MFISQNIHGHSNLTTEDECKKSSGNGNKSTLHSTRIGRIEKFIKEQ
jgi:hypothetical protein